MKGPEFRYVLNTIENEGFECAFVDYSDFTDRVTDPEFHRLREEYLEARKALAVYVGCEEE